MLKCFFTTCPLNEDISLKIYQRSYPDCKQLFYQIDPNDDIIKSSKLISSYKRYIFCKEHLNNLKKYHQLKTDLEKLLQSSPINSQNLLTILEGLNTIIRYDNNMKGICLKMDKIDPISFILSQLTQHNHTIDMLLLLNLSHFLKEITYAKKYSTNDLYLSLTSFHLNYHFAPYELQKQFTNSERDVLLRDSIIYELSLDNLRYILLNAKEKGISLEITTKVTMKTMEMLTSIITYDKKNKTIIKVNNDQENFWLNVSKVEKQVMTASINFIYALLICKNSQIELNSCIVINLCKYGKEMHQCVLGINDISLTLNYIILVDEILNVVMKIKCEEIDMENMEMFLKESEMFIEMEQQFKDNGIIMRIKERIGLIREKMRIGLKKNNYLNKIEEKNKEKEGLL